MKSALSINELTRQVSQIWTGIQFSSDSTEENRGLCEQSKYQVLISQSTTFFAYYFITGFIVFVKSEIDFVFLQPFPLCVFNWLVYVLQDKSIFCEACDLDKLNTK